MDNAIIRYRFDKKKEATKTKTGLLQIEVRKKDSNECTLISTGIRLTKDQFSDKNGFTCVKHPNAAGITGKARNLFYQIEAFVLSEECKSVKDAKNYNNPQKESSKSFIDFMKEELRRRDPSLATIEHHNVLIRKLEEFGEIVSFKDVTYAKIVDFDMFLRKSIKSLATLNKRHNALHYYIKQAINRDLLTKDPYTVFKKPPKKSKEPTFLTEEEINKILEYNPSDERLKGVKDMFCFQIFTGLAYVDLAHFDKSYIKVIDGTKVITSNRTKTDEMFISPLLPEAEEVLLKYKYKLPIISNQKYNDYLKLLGTGAGLTKKLTSHVARHTYATYLINKGVSLESVAKAVGHADIRMTQHYAKLLAKTVISEITEKLNKDKNK